jgi:hypothetical protein
MFKHLRDAILNLLLAGHTRRVNVVDVRPDMARVGLLDEHLQKLGVTFTVLDA